MFGRNLDTAIAAKARQAITSHLDVFLFTSRDVFVYRRDVFRRIQRFKSVRVLEVCSDTFLRLENLGTNFAAKRFEHLQKHESIVIPSEN